MTHPIEKEFAEAMALVEGKAHDYAEDDNVFSNFEFAADAAGTTVEQVFLVLIGVKVARLTQLIANDKEPNNESIGDTLLDLMNYTGLLKAYRTWKASESEWSEKSEVGAETPGARWASYHLVMKNAETEVVTTHDVMAEDLSDALDIVRSVVRTDQGEEHLYLREWKRNSA